VARAEGSKIFSYLYFAMGSGWITYIHETII
jgi:hypothetical protein